MSLFRFFDTATATGFAKTVVEEYCSVRALVDSSKKHAGRKPERMIALIRRISTFIRAQNLNFYVRAKMFSEMKRGLAEAGVDNDEIEEFVRAALLEALRSPV